MTNYRSLGGAMSRCDQEMCPMWDGEGCPCAAFDALVAAVEAEGAS